MEKCERSSSDDKEPFQFESIPILLREKLEEIPEVLEYIVKLQQLLKKQFKKINKLKNKLKKNKSKDVCIQCDYNDLYCDALSVKCEGNQKNEPKCLADDIKEAAEIATQNSGFVYEETSGMYYDYNTGYYYNAEYGLYYDGTNGTYLTYNQETKQYEFHSRVTQNNSELDVEEVTKTKIPTQTKRKNKNRHNSKELKRRRGGYSFHSPTKDVEEGECSDSDASNASDEAKSDSSDLSRQWPPCMRVIIESSDVPKLKVGSLNIITYDGGSLGREGDHSILIPDINTSKHHLKFAFDKTKSCYFLTDLGSRNGTVLNGKRMAPSKQESEAMPITHGSKIQIGSTVLLCHVHEGNQTCGHCEPGLFQHSKESEKEKITQVSREEKYKNELKNLKKICGVTNYEDDPKLASGYTDRAQKRRETVGSQNPHEKTKMASLEESISPENKGFKLLSKMGWKEGQSLGKDNDGMLEPIPLVSNKGSKGVGCKEETVEAARPTEKQNIWKKTQERFQKLPSTNATFDENLEK